MRIFLHVVFILAAVSLGAREARAGAWTRDKGHFYLNLNYSRIAAKGFFGLDYNVYPMRQPGDPANVIYEQHALGLYGEVGLLSRWLTATVEGQLYRRNVSTGQGFTEGLGDLRVGAWTGLITAPVRLSVGFLLGVPTGDPLPSPGPEAEARCRQANEQAGKGLPYDLRACDPVLTANSLPTGDGEWDFETRAALGYGFGGWRRWPLQHYMVAELGYWARNASRAAPRDVFSSNITYKLEFGIKLPWRFIDRFWFAARISGIESFASQEQLQNVGGARASVGLGNGVTYTAYGFDVAGRIYKGLGAQIGLDSAFRARLVAAGANLRVGISYEY